MVKTQIPANPTRTGGERLVDCLVPQLEYNPFQYNYYTTTGQSFFFLLETSEIANCLCSSRHTRRGKHAEFSVLSLFESDRVS